MKITSLEDAVRRPRVLAVGEFDGVHLGHQAVIGDADTVLTFEPHPRAVVGPTGAPELLTTLEQKARLISELGADELVVATFDEEFSKITADEFVEDVLLKQLDARTVRVGANFRFGTRATGTASTLQEDERFSTVVSPLLEVDSQPVSSSRIRELVRDGLIPEATRLLGHLHPMDGVVVHGAKRGRELGYPTANLPLAPGSVVPNFGIYACLADGMPAAASLGIRPTFEDDDAVLLEVFVLDFSGDLYGKAMRIELIERIRPELKFDSIDELKAQMELDCSAAAAICSAALATEG